MLVNVFLLTKNKNKKEKEKKHMQFKLGKISSSIHDSTFFSFVLAM